MAPRRSARWVAAVLLLVDCRGRDEVGARRLALQEQVAAGHDVLAEEAPPDVIVEVGWAGSPDDMDRDGVPEGVDLDDHDELVRAELREVRCDGLDQDGDLADFCPPDADGDGASAERDCDDLDPGIGPRASEIRCNGADENCNGVDDCDRDNDGLRDVDDPDPDAANEAAPLPPGSRRWP